MTTDNADAVARLERLEAVSQIQYVKGRYGELVDGLSQRLDWEKLTALGELFTEDTFVDFVTVQLHGRQAVLDLYGGVMQKNFSWVWHSFHSPVIEVNGDRASGRWTLQGLTIGHDSPIPIAVYGRYKDEFVRSTAGWRISKLILAPGPAGPQNELKLG